MNSRLKWLRKFKCLPTLFLFASPALSQNTSVPIPTSGNKKFRTQQTLRTPSRMQVKIFENSQIVDSSLSRGGVDICDEINKAYAALPSTGGAIWLFANNSGTPYDCKTPIVFGTAGKFVRLESVMVAAAINWTPLTGTAITVNTGGVDQHYQTSIIKGLILTGPGSGTSATGILCGTALVDQALLDSSSIYSFGIGYVWNNCFNSTINHSSITANGVGVSLPNNGELNRIVDSQIANGTTGISITGDAIDLSVIGTSCDTNTTCIAVSGTGNGAIYLSNDHFENPALGSAQYISDTHRGGSWTWNINGGQMLDDAGSGSFGQMMTFGSGDINIDGLNVFSGGRRLTQIINTTDLFCQMKLALIKTGAASRRPTFAGSCPNQNVIDISLDNGTTFVPKLPVVAIGGGTALGRYARYTPRLSPASVGPNTTAEQCFSGVLTAGDFVVGVSKPAAQAGLGIVGWRANLASVCITFSNNTASPITPTASETYQVVAVQ